MMMMMYLTVQCNILCNCCSSVPVTYCCEQCMWGISGCCGPKILPC